MRGFLIALIMMLLTQGLLAQPLDIKELMQELADDISPQVSFVETRYSALLEQPLTVVGELAYRSPNTLIRRTLSPKEETFIIEDKHVTIVRPRQKDRYLPLSAAPALQGLAMALRAVLSGDLGALQTHFSLTLNGTKPSWSLQLKPLDLKIADEISMLNINGQYTQLKSFTIHEPDGDRSEVMLNIIQDASD